MLKTQICVTRPQCVNFAARPHNDASADGRTFTMEETYDEMRCAQNERQT